MDFRPSELKVLAHFFRRPHEKTHLRELSRATGLSVYAVKGAVDELVRSGILADERTGRLRHVRACTGNLFFRYLKIAASLKAILDSRLIPGMLSRVPAVSSIMLFGSVARGEDDEGSDLDLLIIGHPPKALDLSMYEATLKREIKPIIFKWSEWKLKARKDRPFYLEIITDGVCLHGSLPVVE